MRVIDGLHIPMAKDKKLFYSRKAKKLPNPKVWLLQVNMIPQQLTNACKEECCK
jgi:hypothetical protein